eukprot:TRINITY_DN56863_c0_g1_i1.p1 TRINITY_DN56863_c0_g1~~TRINITY_DN56863_c0_g1_i1.p1  ORF type:complete len:376 (+),score=53.27 TRINITY_DN56863_c0_g1_i1:345-1472(+)
MSRRLTVLFGFAALGSDARSTCPTGAGETCKAQGASLPADTLLLQKLSAVHVHVPEAQMMPDEVCYGELPAAATPEGDDNGVLRATSLSSCRQACSSEKGCKSIRFCPESGGCWLHDLAFDGTEVFTDTGRSCKTHYKTSCDQAPALLSSGSDLQGGVKIKVVSYNLFWWNAFEHDSWKGDHIINNIKNRLHADVMGLQECDSAGTIERRTGYKALSPSAGAQGVMGRGDMFTVGDSGSRDIQATGKWGPRYVTWAQLTHKQSGRTFWLFNTHWCVHSGNGRTCTADTRYTGAKNMLCIIREKAGDDPVVITGDFNANMDEPGPKHFLQNGFSLAVVEYVDAVFYSSRHWTKVWAGAGDAAHSDHRPVIAELELK